MEKITFDILINRGRLLLDDEFIADEIYIYKGKFYIVNGFSSEGIADEFNTFEEATTHYKKLMDAEAFRAEYAETNWKCDSEYDDTEN